MDLSQKLRTRQLLINFDGGRPVLSLRAPLDLVNFPSISRPRWPVECEVISDVVQHIGKMTCKHTYANLTRTNNQRVTFTKG